MNLTERQQVLFEFIKVQHGDQVRKYTGEPYTNHVYSVAEIVSEYLPEMVEVALGHDLFEDTECTPARLYRFLRKNGYEVGEANFTVMGIVDLTDVYTHEMYPEINRKARKRLEAERLGKVSGRSQTVKYADLIDNTSSIVENDKGFAKKYLEEKREILRLMKNGNEVLYTMAMDSLADATKEVYSHLIGKRISFTTSQGKLMKGTAQRIGVNRYFGWFQVTVDRTPFRYVDPTTIKTLKELG